MRTKRLIVTIIAAICIAAVGAVPLNAQSSDTYVVRPGDTMLKIAARYEVSVSQLARANGLRWNSWVYAGQRLTVPGSQPGASPAPDTVVAWVGRIVSLPRGSQHAYYFERSDGEGFGIGGIDDLVSSRIEELRRTGQQFSVWGALRTDVPSYGSRYIAVECLEVSQPEPSPAPDTVVAWVGRIVSLPRGSQHAYYFERSDGEGFGIGAIDDLMGRRIAGLRWSGEQFLVWGALRTDVPSYAGRYIEVEYLELSQPEPSPAPDTVVGWVGRIVSLPRGSQHAYYFERSDGEGFGIGGIDDLVGRRIEELRWSGEQFLVWGSLRTDVPSYGGRYIAVEYLEVVPAPTGEPRNLTPLASLSVSSFLRTDRWGQYQPWMAVDDRHKTGWAEGVPGPGVGEWIMLTFPGTIEVQSVGLDIGYDKNADIFFKNNRIKKATLVFSNGERVELGFADKRGMQTIPLVRAPGPNIETSFIKVIIEEVFPGWKYDDTCLAEIEVWGQAI